MRGKEERKLKMRGRQWERRGESDRLKRREGGVREEAQIEECRVKEFYPSI